MKTLSAIHTEKILKDLNELWVTLGQESEGGVLRACAMTLIAVTGESEQGTPSDETLAALMHEHPSRAIVLRLNPGEDRVLDARVQAQCWTLFGRRQNICCEQIEIAATRSAIDELPPVLRGLLAPDLPVVIWVRLDLPELDLLFPLAGKIIFDTGPATNAADALTRLAAVRRSGCRVADLNWSRLTRWREAVAQIFEDPAQRAKLDRSAELTVAHRSADPPVRAYYLAAWFQRSLGRPLRFHFQRESGAEAGEIQRVSLGGAGFDCAVARSGAGHAAEVRIGELTMPAVFTVQSDYELLRAELSIAGADAVYDEVQRLATELALQDRSGS